MNEKLDSKTLPVDVLAVMESVWHQGLDETNVRDFEKARAAVAELIEADVAYDNAYANATADPANEAALAEAEERRASALARVKGESA